MTKELYPGLTEIISFMKESPLFIEQADTHNRRFYFNRNGEKEGYLSFKHIWGGYKLFFRDNREPVIIENLDHLKSILSL